MSASFTIVGRNTTDAGRVVGLAPATFTALPRPSRLDTATGHAASNGHREC
jgi:hypothetical protein